jgi:uncharacterized LabA/DUF88 family protein
MRMYIQLDVQNLFFSAKDIQKRIDFLKIRNHFHETGNEIVGLVAYIVRSPDIGKSDKFESFLENIGYTLSIKKAIIGYKPNGDRIFKDTDQDMAICIDCMKNVDSFDKWVLMSGDGDFIDLCRELKKRKKTVEVWSLPGTSFNKRLCDYVDSVHFLGEQFFFEDPKLESDTNRELNQKKEAANEKSRSNLQTISAATKKATA